MSVHKQKLLACVAGLWVVAFLCCCKKGNSATPPPPQTPIAIPLAGNAYITQLAPGGSAKITKDGLKQWADKNSIVSIYFKLPVAGELHIGLRGKAVSGTSTIKIAVNGSEISTHLSAGEFKTYFAGTVAVKNAGYIKVDLQGIQKSGSYFAEISDVLIGGSSTKGDLIFANDPENFYWSRRGPSCHLNYAVPNEDKEYFYSELTVPPGEDKMSTYFMANGFGEGYMGIQVNSPTERRVLFSVWDADSGKTTLVRKGEAVIAQEFGGEGTGGQSYLVFPWKAGTTYKFLTRGKPDNSGNTIYTSWFFAPESGNWQLIASWKRPHIHTYLTRFHGFLENFNPNEGYQQRKAYWTNQWVRLANGNWKEVTSFTFSVDATGRNKQRQDYAGGVENGKFFLQMGGFFNDHVSPGTVFTKPATGQQPVINPDTLP
ncbi:MAG: DUF5077 domain-containing protein [Chitinophagaceae bacterium]|nr:DUF5077 domain-containing protein [Chitinophagaceae bacterium]